VSKSPTLLFEDDVKAFLDIFRVRLSRKDELDPSKTGRVHVDLKQVKGDEKRSFGKQLKLTEAEIAKVPSERELHLDPISIAHLLIEKARLNLDEEDLKSFHEIFAQSFPIDRETGFYEKSCKPLVAGLAHFNAKTNKTPVCLIEGDFTNMGGANDSALGREGTNKLIYKISQILKSSFANTFPDKAIEVHGVRAGGDEVQLAVYGLTKAEVDKVINEKIRPEINMLAAQFGVHDIAHKKIGKLPGFGAAFASVELGQRETTAAIRTALDSGVAQSKEEDGFLRFGLIDDERVNRYIEQIYVPLFKANHNNEEPSDDEKAQKRASLGRYKESTKAYWQTLIAPGGEYHDEYEGFIKTNPASVSPHDFFNYQSEQNKGNVKQALEAIHLAEEGIVQPPFFKTNIPFRDEPPEMQRMRMAFKQFSLDKLVDGEPPLVWNDEKRFLDLDRKRLNHVNGPILRMIIDFYRHFIDAPDPASRAKTNRFRFFDADALKNHYQGARIVEFEFQNLNGLNNLNYEIADAALRDTTKYITDGLKTLKHPPEGIKSVADRIYNAGPKFTVVLPPEYTQEDVRALHKYVAGQIKTHIADCPIGKFAKNTYTCLRTEENTPKATKDEIAAMNAESKQKDIALEKDIERVSEGLNKNSRMPKKLVKMSDVPHPKDPEKSIGIKFYTDVIAAKEDTVFKLKRIDALADSKFNGAARITATAV